MGLEREEIFFIFWSLFGVLDVKDDLHRTARYKSRYKLQAWNVALSGSPMFAYVLDWHAGLMAVLAW